MVLDEASLSSNPDTDSPPSSDTDPYDPASDAIRQPLIIDISTLPRPLPFFGPLFGYTRSYTAKVIGARASYVAAALRRPLSPQESDAVAYHTAKGLAIASWGPAVGTLAGASRAYQTSERYRFPFMGEMKKEGGWWDGERIRIMGEEMSKGLGARQRVHALRGTLYICLGTLFGSVLVSSYAATVAAVGELRDERLKELTNAMRTQVMKQRAEVTRDMRKDRAMETATGQGEKSASDLWKDHRGAIGGANNDDASPTGGMAEYSSDELSEDESRRLAGMTDQGAVMIDGQIRSQEAMQQAEPIRRPAAATHSTEKEERQPRSFDDDYDDASPTAGNIPEESAWDRIRREAGSTSASVGGRRRAERGSGMQQEQRDEGDSFSFSSDEGERQLAKDEAQREFDERVEKERRGGDFGSGRRW